MNESRTGHRLSASQLALWEHQLARPDDRTYGMVGVVRSREPLKLDALRRAWRALLEQHGILRCRVFSGADGPRAFEQPLDGIEDASLLPFVDAIDWQAPRLQAQWDAYARQAWRLDQPMLFRGVAMCVQPSALVAVCGKAVAPDGPAWVLHMTAHHLVIDYLSLPLLLQELQQHYRSALGMAWPPSCRSAKGDFWSFAAAQQAWLESEEGSRALQDAAEWLHPPVPRLALDGRELAASANSALATSSEEIRCALPDSARRVLSEAARTHGVTAFVAMLSAFQVLLWQYGSGTEVAIATPVHGRKPREFLRTIGYFANAAILRLGLTADLSFATLMRRNHVAVRRALRLGAVPFPALREAVCEAGALAGRPTLAEAAVVWDVLAPPVADAGSDLFEILLVQQTGTPYDLVLTVYAEAERWVCGVRYRPPAVDAALAQRLLEGLAPLATALATSPDLALCDIALVDAAPWRTTPARMPWPEVDPIESALLRHARQSRPRTALADGQRTLDYAELELDSRRLARALQARLVAEDRVVLLFERGVDVVRAIVASWRAGVCYVPLNPGQADSWLREALGHARPRLVICSAELKDRVRALGHEPCTLEELGQSSAFDAVPTRPSPSALQTAYIIYTSGSTGAPKGVAIARASLLCLLQDDLFDGDEGETACWTLAHHPSFDFSVWEMWGALRGGQSLRVLSDAELRSPPLLHAVVLEAGVTHMGLTPSAAQLLVPMLERLGKGTLHTVCLGGAAVPTGLVKRCRDLRLSVWIYYGPTECTVWATRRWVDDDADGAFIGSPLPGMRAYVLNDGLQWVPEGVCGELYLAGPQLADYYRAPRLTSAAFVPDPWQPGQRMYRTGDRVRRSRDGVVFVGRKDRQVKVNGYRVELDEIEQRLSAATSGVPLCCLLADDGSLVVLHSNVGTQSGPGVDWHGLARQHLPRHVLPLRFMAIERLPLTSNGKPDISAAAEIVRQAILPQVTNAPRLKSDYVRLLGDALREELGRAVPADQNFHDAGASSLNLSRVHARLQTVLQRPLELADLYTFTTIERLAAWLADGAAGGHAALLPAHPAAKPRLRLRRTVRGA